jgi:hypothetical protein
MVMWRGAGRRERAVLWLGVGLYLLVLALSPSLHHDFKCHDESPSHCDACMASPPGLCAATGVSLEATHLRDVGRVEAARSTAPERTFTVEAPGRSPPS